MKIDIIDDFLTDYQHQSLLRTFGVIDGPKGGSSFPSYFNDNLNDEERLGNFYFTNIVMDGYNILNEYWVPVFNPLLSKLNVPLNTVWRVKANLYPRTQWRIHHKSHVDYVPDSGFETWKEAVDARNRSLYGAIIAKSNFEIAEKRIKVTSPLSEFME